MRDKITFYDLLDSINLDNKLTIVNFNYDEKHFGNFLVNLSYGNNLYIQILNDRGIIEIVIKKRILIMQREIPMKFAINYILGIHETDDYSFNSITDVYKFLQNSYYYLDYINKESTMKSIFKHYKHENKKSKRSL